MKLQHLIDDFKRSRGVGRYVQMQRIREYVNNTDVFIVLEEIKRMDETKDLDILLGVGMRGVLWKAVVGRQAYIEGVS
ncbi:MAG: hypothetical protein HWN68_12800 [Desulfobacterales bacterium]|nr:hypothetical protein [Desulfobacterales bacterium]